MIEPSYGLALVSRYRDLAPHLGTKRYDTLAEPSLTVGLLMHLSAE